MTMNKYFKQVEYIEEMKKKVKWDAGVKRDFRTLAKYLYYKSEYKFTPTELYKEIVKICNKKGKAWFNETLDFQLIDKCVSEARKSGNNIIQIEKINITESEWNLINDIDLDLTQKERKILFGLLIHAKLKNERYKIQDKENNDKLYFGGNGKHSYKQLLDSLNDKYTRTFLDKDVHLMIKKFNELGLVKTYYNSSVELLFMNQAVESDDKVIIYNFDNAGLYWEYEFNNPKVKKCELCNTPYKKTNGNKLKCESCSSKIRQEYKNKWKKDNWKTS